jgi:hypothetical protein
MSVTELLCTVLGNRHPLSASAALFSLPSLLPKSFGHVCDPGPKTGNHGAATGNQSAPEGSEVMFLIDLPMQFVENLQVSLL